MNTVSKEIQHELFQLRDEEYGIFQAKLIPTVSSDTIIGVRTLELRKYAKQLAKSINIDEYLKELPHSYFDENQLHAFIISEIKDYDRCIEEINLFLPYIDNWATCDQMSPKIFKKHRPELLESINVWIASGRTYTIRFAVGMLMEHFLDEDFDPAFLEIVAKIRSNEYYVNMMIAWYFATALATQYTEALPYIEQYRLDAWTHNRTIQKAVESYRITLDQKTHLRKLKIKTITKKTDN